ncbi:hypothetical protein B0H16DRAFT_1461447 [Mycena metata]|uniref:Uncharacterized protein n=1 Tax=Mycena metata TaxID=1033252 RepID=A0AAD7N6M8_9AGAR|nr:hypothetical protein B0H16DRAFT_1461447 [Mycena metata]
MSSLNEVHGHVLSNKSQRLGHDTFIFMRMSQRSQLFLRLNQKLMSVSSSSATLHRWMEFMTSGWNVDTFFLCPVSISSAGILAYFATPSGPPIESDGTDPIPPGNYGWYHDRECQVSGPGCLGRTAGPRASFAVRFSTKWPEDKRSVLDPFPTPIRDVVVARDAPHCKITGLEGETEDWMSSDWDTTPFFTADNVLIMHPDLAHSWYSNHLTIDVDDNYRIVLFHPDCAQQAHLPTHLPLHAQHNAAVDHFFRLHCHFSLHYQLRGGDIMEDYSNWFITQLGVEDPDGRAVLGQAILEHVLEQQTSMSLYWAEEDRERAEMDASDSGSGEDENDEDPDEDEAEELRVWYDGMDLTSS